MSMKWYVLHTLSSHEAKVKKIIEFQKLKWPDGQRIGQIKIPTLDMAELHNGKKRIVKKKFMPGYVFIELEITDELIHQIRNVVGVMGFVGTDAKPQVLTEEEMQSLFAEMGDAVSSASEEKVLPKILFSEGETVKIIDGPFANFQGVIDEVNIEKGKLRVRVEIFGRSTPVELDYLQVGKI